MLVLESSSNDRMLFMDAAVVGYPKTNIGCPSSAANCTPVVYVEKLPRKLTKKYRDGAPSYLDFQRNEIC